MSHKGPKCRVIRKLPPNCEGFPTSRTSKTEWMAVSCSKIASLPADDEISKEDPREILQISQLYLYLRRLLGWASKAREAHVPWITGLLSSRETELIEWMYLWMRSISMVCRLYRLRSNYFNNGYHWWRLKAQYLFSPRDWMSQLFFIMSLESQRSRLQCLWRNGLVSESKQAERKQFFLLCHLYKLPAEVVAWIKVGLPTSKDLDLECAFSPQMTQSRNTLTGVPSHLGFS